MAVCNKIRLYPRSGAGVEHRIEGSKIYGSNTSPIADLVELATIGTVTDASWYELTFSNSVEYKYLLLKHLSNYVEVSELEFYSGTTKLTPISTFGSAEYSGAVPVPNAFDGNTSSIFVSAASSGGYIGIEVAPPVLAVSFNGPTSINAGDPFALSSESITGGSGSITSRKYYVDNVEVVSIRDQVDPTIPGGTLTVNTNSPYTRAVKFEVIKGGETASVTKNVFVGQITGDRLIAYGQTKSYSGNAPLSVLSVDSGGGTAAGSNYTAPGAGNPYPVIRFIKSGDPTIFATKVLEIQTQIDTASPISGVVGANVSGSFAASGGSGTGTWSKVSGNFPTDVSMNSAGVKSGSLSAAGSFSFRLRYVDSVNSGNYVEKDFVWTVAAAPPTPTSKWSSMQLITRKDILFWNALDLAEDATEIGDFSGNNNTLVCASSVPELQASVLNGKPAIYFDGTKNPLKFSKTMSVKHIFLIAKYDGASFTGNEGLISGLAANSILRGNGSTTTKFANLSIGSGFSYSKNYVPFGESNELAPMNAFGIIELRFPSGISLDGLQIGQDTNNTGRKWKGWFVEVLGYDTVKNYFERLAIYEYFALKFFLWRFLPDGKVVFPFPNNHQSPFTPSRYKIQSPALPNGLVKTRVKGSKLQQFEFNYTTRRQAEASAIDKFETDYFDGRTIAVEHNAFYPPRRYNVTPTTEISVEPAGINLFNYRWNGRQADTTATEIEV